MPSRQPPPLTLHRPGVQGVEVVTNSADDLHVIGFSGGKDSTSLALRLCEVEPRPYVLVCTPTGDEMPGWHEHMRRVAEMTSCRLQVVTCGHSLNGLIERQRMIPNARARWCTRMLKIEPYRKWLSAATAQHGHVVSYVGLRADEAGRAGGAYEDIPGVEMRFPLREWGWGLAEVMSYLERRGVEIPERTDCARCFFQRLPEWWLLWRDHPGLYLDAEEQEARISADRGHPCTFRSPSRDTWPAGLADLRAEFERGRVPRGGQHQHDLFRGSGACRVCSL